MSVFKDSFKKLFMYSEEMDKYDFVLPESKNSRPHLNQDDSNHPSSNPLISDSLDKNLNALKCSYNSLINSDIILREFTITVNGKIFRALLVAIDGLISSELVNNYLLKPLMLKNNNKGRPIPSLTKNGVKIKKLDNFNLENYLYNTLIPQNSIEKITSLGDLVSSVNSGSCALVVDTLTTAFVIDVKGFESRSVSVPINETIIRGAQEGFVEKLRTNTSMLRRIINNENLIIENSEVRKT